MVGYFFTSKNFNWGTPAYIVEAIRESLGGNISLDPCSSEEHNTRIKAGKFYVEEGELKPWNARSVFVNHPGDKTGKSSKKWWNKFVTESAPGKRMAWLDFNPNRLMSLEPNPFSVVDAMVLLRKRVAYIGNDAKAPPMNSWVGLVNPATTENWEGLGHIVDLSKTKEL